MTITHITDKEQALMRENERLTEALEKAYTCLDKSRNAVRIQDVSIELMTEQVTKLQSEIDELGAALKAQPVQEPVALPGDLVIKALRAMDAEARKRGEMYPQTLDEQREDTKAVRNVIASLEFYTGKKQCSNGWPSVKDWPALPSNLTSAPMQPVQPALTDEQLWALWNSQGTDYMNQQEAVVFARAIEAALAVPKPIPRHGFCDHPDDEAAERFCAKMKYKLGVARQRGKSGWDDPNWTPEMISQALREHVEKGDPVDVANYCMFLAARKEPICAAPAQPVQEPVAWQYKRTATIALAYKPDYVPAGEGWEPLYRDPVAQPVQPAPLTDAVLLDWIEANCDKYLIIYKTRKEFDGFTFDLDGKKIGFKGDLRTALAALRTGGAG